MTLFIDGSTDFLALGVCMVGVGILALVGAALADMPMRYKAPRRNRRIKRKFR